MAPATDRANATPDGTDQAFEFWHTPYKRPFASILRGRHWASFALESSAFKRLLAYTEYRATGKILPSAKLDDMVRQMIGQALFDG